MELRKVNAEDSPPKDSVEFFSSGSTLLDLALGGGWAQGRIFNVVGDRSSGKTLLAIEAFANFSRSYPRGRMRYAEAESAFDESYAQTLGFPTEVTQPDEPIQTVEQFHDDLAEFSNKPGPALYILDSLDALSDAAEMEKAISDGSYGTGKAKKMSETFRRLTKTLGEQNCTLGIISQIRDRIGVQFGETKTRSGGRALDFYASQILWLSEVSKIERQIKGVKRVVGVDILGKVKKCKVGIPFRTAEMRILLGYGIDDEESMINWLLDVKAIEKEVAKGYRIKLDQARDNRDYTTLKQLRTDLSQDVKQLWIEIEKELAPPIQKYVE